ncbi:DNA adenine methylase [Deinococcus murrayi]|uniref:DNA adenine methylase n=1 Tax=Deinococcus murrayi TaxID=68910 RepID=UPI0009FF82A0|nr:DNA adenine methylase [Deinococcus murrayi]
MIKYLGSKRTLVPVLGAIAEEARVTSAVDLFTGTTRVAQEFKRRGLRVLANDIATYSEVMSQCYISTDAKSVDMNELACTLQELNQLPGKRGYFTRTFCEEARFFQPKNGERIDAIRDAIEERYSESWMRPILLTSLMAAADRVDSTTGVQMAYLKEWASRSYNDLELRLPNLISGSGITSRCDALDLVRNLPRQELVYLDPPYNQHRYFTNYHIWETLIRWDEPETYGVARKRLDSRDASTKSVYNMKREMPKEMQRLLNSISADLVVVSYNNESWIEPNEMMILLREAGFEDVRLLAFDYKRYVGAQIGIHNPSGERVGQVSHLRNLEYIFLAGASDVVDACAARVEHRTAASAPVPLF